MGALSRENTYSGLFRIRQLVILSRNVPKQREGITESPQLGASASCECARLFLEDRILSEEKQFSRNPEKSLPEMGGGLCN